MSYEIWATCSRCVGTGFRYDRMATNDHGIEINVYDVCPFCGGIGQISMQNYFRTEAGRLSKEDEAFWSQKLTKPLRA